MPYISDVEWSDFKRRMSLVENGIEQIEDKLKEVKGQPFIRGSVGKVLEINDSLSILSLKKEITDIKERLDAHSI